MEDKKYNTGELLKHGITADKFPERLQIAILKAKMSELESQSCDCMRDPEDERKYYKKLEEENIRLRKIIKLLSETL